MKILKLYTIIILILCLINSLYQHIKDGTRISIIIGGLLIEIPVLIYVLIK